MRNFVKWFGIIAFAAAIGFSIAGCDLFSDDFEKLNGDWDRAGEYLVTFTGGKGVFKELYGGMWLNAYNAGIIKIGEQCYRNLEKSDDTTWTGEIRVYNSSSPYQTLRWENCTITLKTDSQDGQTLQISTTSAGTFSCTKK